MGNLVVRDLAEHLNELALRVDLVQLGVRDEHEGDRYPAPAKI